MAVWCPNLIFGDRAPAKALPQPHRQGGKLLAPPGIQFNHDKASGNHLRNDRGENSKHWQNQEGGADNDKSDAAPKSEAITHRAVCSIDPVSVHSLSETLSA